MMLDKTKHLKPGRWCWIVQNENKTEQYRVLGIFIQYDHLGDALLVVCDGEEFTLGTYSIADLIPLNNCTGWDYSP